MGMFHVSFWLLGTIAVVLRFNTVRRNPEELFSPLTFIIVGYFWLYVLGYLLLDPWTKSFYLSQAGYTKVLILATLSALAFWLGYQKTRPARVLGNSVDHMIIEISGVILILGGIVGWMYFIILSGGFFEYYGAPHGSAGAWKETSAYLYGTFLLLFPGVSMLLAIKGGRRLFLFSSIVLFVAFLFLCFDAWVAGLRGTWLRLAVVIGTYLIFLHRSTRDMRFLVVGLMCGFGTLIILTPTIREAVFIGTDQPLNEALMHGLEQVTGHAEQGWGNELVFASALVEASSEQGVMDFGYQWLHPIINVIPRLWWPDKPYVSEFSISYDLTLWRSFGWGQSSGSAPTGVADAFVRFSWASPLVWFFLGILGRRLFDKAKIAPGVKTVGYLNAYLFGLIYMIIQGFNAAVYAAMYMATPLFMTFFVADHIGFLTRSHRV